MIHLSEPTVTGFYASRRRTYSCTCGWQGRGEETLLGDIESVLFHRFGLTALHCPVCEAVLAPVSLVDLDDVLAHRDEADEQTVAHAESAKRAIERWQEHHLARPDQLPELPAETFIAHWEPIVEDGIDLYRITVDGREIWREAQVFPGVSWRGPQRFREIARILRARYGFHVGDLVPSEKQIEAWSYPPWHDLGRERGPEHVAEELRRVRSAVLGAPDVDHTVEAS